MQSPATGPPVSDGLLAAVRAVLPEREVVEILQVIGYYRTSVACPRSSTCMPPSSTPTNKASSGAIRGLACLAGDWHQAAVLHGAGQAFRDRTAPLDSHTTRSGARTASTKRAHLGDEQLEPPPRVWHSALTRPST
jgi:hypothetical protein